MRKVLFISLFFVSFIGFSQQSHEKSDEKQRKNEMRLNGLYFAIGAFEGTYERILNDESAVGISLLLPFSNTVNINYYVSPYYRFYFGKKYAQGFFFEGFGMLNSIGNDYISYNIQGDIIDRGNSKTDFALGIGLGGKWVTKSGFLGEIGFGIGRNLFNSNNANHEDVVGKFAITIGYRF